MSQLPNSEQPDEAISRIAGPMNQLYDYQQAAQKDLETIAPHLRTIRKWVKIYPRLEPFLFITQPHLVVDNTRKQKRFRPNNDPKPPEAA